MREFKCNPFECYSVDLDDPETYQHLPDNVEDLRNKIFQEIGYAYCYMNFYRKEIYSNENILSISTLQQKERIEENTSAIIINQQKERVELLIDYFTKHEVENQNNVRWYQEQLFLFENETENMI